jgi:hypothetical protein
VRQNPDHHNHHHAYSRENLKSQGTVRKLLQLDSITGATEE